MTAAQPDEDSKTTALEELEKRFPKVDVNELRAQLMMAQASQGSGQLLSAEGSVSGHVTIASTGTVGISDTGGSPSSCVQSAQQTLQAALSTAQKTTPLWLRVAEELVAYATYYITVSDC